MTNPARARQSGPSIPRQVGDFQVYWPGTALEAHGLVLETIDENRAVVMMPITDAVRQPLGWLHGGMTMMLAESAASLHACWGVDLSERVPVGVEINGSHVRSCRSGRIRAVATVVRRSSALIVHTVEIFSEKSGELLSTCRVTNYYRRQEREGAV
ncbi:MAG: PaaI family thioesterase [Opitutaceae bacterium]|nr:PaaI family thioesterase [Opitutaceae bacterium]